MLTLDLQFNFKQQRSCFNAIYALSSVAEHFTKKSFTVNTFFCIYVKRLIKAATMAFVLS